MHRTLEADRNISSGLLQFVSARFGIILIGYSPHGNKQSPHCDPAQRWDRAGKVEESREGGQRGRWEGVGIWDEVSMSWESYDEAAKKTRVVNLTDWHLSLADAGITRECKMKGEDAY
eukprot:g21737.t1